MRSYLIPIAIAFSLGGAGLAMAAATTTEGTIKALQLKHHHITLSNGTTYTLPTSVKAPALKVGEKVSIVWEMMGKKHEISAITVVN